MDPQEIGSEMGKDCTVLVWDRDKRQALVNTLMNSQVP
jgi:hypothetical protein